jgi:P27 family predicted phage terminase small subunit
MAPDLPAPVDPLRPSGQLNSAERAAWKKHVEWVRALKLESRVDAGCFEALVRAYCRARAADQVVAKQGLTFEGLHGPRPRPEVLISRNSWHTYQVLAQQFGMTPAARAKFGTSTARPEKASDLPAELSGGPAKSTGA